VKLDTFERSSSFYTWLYRIAVNMALSHRRRHRTSVSLDGLHDQSGREPVDGGDGPDGRLRSQENVSQVHKALAELSEEYRVVLVLREMDDLSYDAIAEILDVPIGTVRSRLHRARLELRAILKKSTRDT
ncbi:MAG TPA: sigma-70 family RNA polymerase sigma factor, partial [Pirellulales bacterium]|nr:sigma-70 family RNA polymerase sigma factor [Pirellulales bacterium]